MSRRPTRSDISSKALVHKTKAFDLLAYISGIVMTAYQGAIMINPIQFIKDIIDILRDPPGEAEAALEITSENIDTLLNTPNIDPRLKAHLKLGYFLVDFRNMLTVVPPKDFHKHYEFDGPVHTGPDAPLTRIRTIKPL
jgi:hypothetical protein